ERQAPGNPRQFFTPGDFLQSEAVDENLADRRHERRSAGQKDVIDIVRRNACPVEESIDAARHQRHLTFYPRLELATGDLLADRHRLATKLEHRLDVHRKVELDSPDGLMQPKSHFVLDEVYERLEALRYQRGAAEELEHLQVFGGVEKREMMPTLQTFVGPARDRQEFVGRREILRPKPQPRRDELADDLS